MTLDQWTDEIARMTPRQRQAVGYAMEAEKIACIGYRTRTQRPDIGNALTAPRLAARRALERVYPGETARRD